MQFEAFDTQEEMEERLDEVRAAFARETERSGPWQELVKAGCFYACIDPNAGMVYGEIIEEKYPEDAELMAQPHMRGYRTAKAYSVMCPYGEMGTVHVTNMDCLITKGCFDAFKAEGWPEDPRAAALLLRLIPGGVVALRALVLNER